MMVAGANGPTTAPVQCRAQMDSEGETDNATSPHPRTEENNAKEILLKLLHVRRNHALSMESTKHGENGAFATKFAVVERRPENANASSPNMAANPAREWQARPRLATKNLAPLMDSGTHGVCGPNVPSHAVEVPKRALAHAPRLKMAAKLALVTPRKQKLATTRPAQSTACGSNGDTGQSARNHAVAESRTERENVTVPSSEEKNARANPKRKRNVAPANVQLMESSLLGLPGASAAKNAVVVNKRERANVTVPFLEGMSAMVTAQKYRNATPTTAPSTESGASGVIGPTVPRHVQVDSPRKLAPAKGPSMADGIVRETIKYPKSATRLHAPSMDSGSHGETGKSVPPPAEVERRSARENVKDLNMAEMIAPEMSSNRLSLATPLPAQSTEFGASGLPGASASRANSSRPVVASDLSSVVRIAKETARRSKIVKLPRLHIEISKPALSIRI